MRNVVQLEEEQAKRHETIQLTYDRLYPLWTMLGVPEEEMDGFVNQWTGSTIEVINAVRLSLAPTTISPIEAHVEEDVECAVSI